MTHIVVRLTVPGGRPTAGLNPNMRVVVNGADSGPAHLVGPPNETGEVDRPTVLSAAAT